MPNTDTMIARIALSLWTSARKVERLPRVLEVQPWELVGLVETPMHLRETFALSARFGVYEGI